MNKRYYEHTLPIIRGSLSNTYITEARRKCEGHIFFYIADEKVLKEVQKRGQ